MCASDSSVFSVISMEDFGGKVIRAPSLKRGKTEERITDRVSTVASGLSLVLATIYKSFSVFL